MKWEEAIGVTLNTGILSIFYTALGGIISYILYFFVDKHDADWEKKSTWYQVGDVTLQLSIVGTIAFWVTYLIREAAPIFPVSKDLDALVDTYISGVFFAYAVFLFIEHLNTKVKFLYHKMFDHHMEKMFPLRKTDKKKTS